MKITVKCKDLKAALEIVPAKPDKKAHDGITVVSRDGLVSCYATDGSILFCVCYDASQFECDNGEVLIPASIANQCILGTRHESDIAIFTRIGETRWCADIPFRNVSIEFDVAHNDDVIPFSDIKRALNFTPPIGRVVNPFHEVKIQKAFNVLSGAPKNTYAKPAQRSDTEQYAAYSLEGVEAFGLIEYAASDLGENTNHVKQLIEGCA